MVVVDSPVTATFEGSSVEVHPAENVTTASVATTSAIVRFIVVLPLVELACATRRQ